MSLTTRLDKLEAAMRGRDPPNGSWICRRLIYDPLEWACEEDEAISRMQADELDRLVAGGIREIDRQHVRFIVHRIVYPPERPDHPLEENAAGGGYSFSTRLHSPNVR
jgi:hypothetical protein